MHQNSKKDVAAADGGVMKLYGAVKKMTLITGVSSFVIIAAAAVYYCSFLIFPFALGVFLTAALNVLKLIMLERAVERAVNMEGENAENFIRFQYLLRYLLTALVLLLAAKTPFISLWGAAAGILTLKIAVFFVSFLSITI